MTFPEKFTLKQFCETARCSLRHAYDMIKEGYLNTVQEGGTQGWNHLILRADWEEYFARLEADRARLNKAHLRFPVTKAGETPAAVVPKPFDKAAALATKATIEKAVARNTRDAIERAFTRDEGTTLKYAKDADGRSWWWFSQTVSVRRPAPAPVGVSDLSG